MTVAIITDSTGGLTKAFAKKHNLTIVPLKIHWGEETLLDNVDITPDEFYKRLVNEPVLPTTSQPSMNDFLQAYKNVPPEYESIVVPLISSGVSGTVDSAESAVLEYKERPVKIVDSLTTGSALALIAKEAALAAKAGDGLEAIYNKAVKSSHDSFLYFVVDTLKYLHKGGRIGGASRYLGSALQIKPVLYLDENGKIDAYERIRTKRKALNRLVSIIAEKAAGRKVIASVMHAMAPETAAQVAEQVKEHLHLDDVMIVDISPAIGVHVGPGTIGIAAIPIE